MSSTFARSSPWLLGVPVQQARSRLFCFSYAGGSAFNFTSWQYLIDPATQIAAVQLPGRGARIAEPPIDSMPALLRALAPEIAAQDDLPFAFFGHSVGALIAFELTRYMQLHGLTLPGRLFLSGCQAPRYRSPSRQLHLLSDDAFIDVLSRYNGTPPEVLQNRELMQLLLPSIRADFALAGNYRYRAGPLLPMPISVFAGRQDDNKAPGQVDGWARETADACSVTWFEGGHFFVNGERAEVLARMGAELSLTPPVNSVPMH